MTKTPNNPIPAINIVITNFIFIPATNNIINTTIIRVPAVDILGCNIINIKNIDGIIKIGITPFVKDFIFSYLFL